VGTEPLKACPGGDSGDAWPLDINMDTFITVVGDVLPYSGRIGATGGPPPGPNWRQRLDLNKDNRLTVVGDVLKFAGKIGMTCTSGRCARAGAARRVHNGFVESTAHLGISKFKWAVSAPTQPWGRTDCDRQRGGR